jgi:hypothetical protein
VNRQAQGAALAVLLCCIFPVFSEERTDRGRFGAEDDTPSEEAEFDKQIYLGLRTGPSLRIYTPEDDIPYTGGDASSFSMDAAFQANFRALPFLSFQAEIIWTWDDLSLDEYIPVSLTQYNISAREYTSFSFRFPLLLRLDFYPGAFRVSPFFGIYYFQPLGKLTVNDSQGKRRVSWKASPPIGLTGGLSVGRKAGPGIVFADLRWDIDLGEVEPGKDIPAYRRSMITLSVGYEFAFFPVKRNKP